MKRPKFPDFRADVIHGTDRKFYSTRLIALCIAVASLTAAIVSVPVVLVLNHEAQEQTYKDDVKACERTNNARKETNIRLVTQRRDAKNLATLATKMAEVRTAEAAAFTKIGEGFEIQKEVAPLVKLLKVAGSKDKQIANEQNGVIFKRVPILNCYDTRIVPKP